MKRIHRKAKRKGLGKIANVGIVGEKVGIMPKLEKMQSKRSNYLKQQKIHTIYCR